MDIQNKVIREIKWEIAESDIKRRMDQKFLFIMTFLTIGLSLVLIFIFSKHLALFAVVFFIILASTVHYVNAKIKYEKGIPMESYKIDEKGIEINNPRENKKNLFLWSQVSGYHISDKNLDNLIGFFFDILGRKVIIYINDHEEISVNIKSKKYYEEIIEELSKRTAAR